MLTILLSLWLSQIAVDDRPAAVEEGLRVYRSKCARCHDVNAQGYRGADLTQLQRRNLSNAQLAALISRGIPGTDMPAVAMSETELSRVIAYLRSLGGPAVVDRGDAKRGETLFWGKGQCGQCHMVRGRGGRLGQDLTLTGALRSKSFLIRELQSPSEYIPKGYDAIRVVTLTGEQITGVRKNEDNFSIQLMDTNESLRSFLKSELRETVELEQSLMPSYAAPRWTGMELDDVLKYLASLR